MTKTAGQKIAAKILTHQRRKFQAYRIFIVHNYRIPDTGYRNYSILASMGTYRSTDLGDVDRRKMFHDTLEIILLRLATEGYAADDIAAIRKKISAVIPQPAGAAVPAPKKLLSIETVNSLRERFPLIRD